MRASDTPRSPASPSGMLLASASPSSGGLRHHRRPHRPRAPPCSLRLHHGLIAKILEDHAPARPPRPRPPVPHADPPTLVGSRVISISMRQRPALDDPSSPSPRRPGPTSLHRRRPRLPVHPARFRHRHPNGSFTKGSAPDRNGVWITSSAQTPAPRRDACCAWLTRFLAAGPVPSPYLHECAASAGFSKIMRVSVHRERPFRSIVNTCFGPS